VKIAQNGTVSCYSREAGRGSGECVTTRFGHFVLSSSVYLSTPPKFTVTTGKTYDTF
jgi:hypothetical protein